MKSTYNLRFQLPYEDRVMLMHGYTGALDIVSPKLADFLTSSNGDDPAGQVSRGARETLQDRGYLTQQTDAEEREHVSKILDVFTKRQKASITLGLRLKGSSEELQAGFLANLDTVFSALNGLRAHHVGGALAVDLTSVNGSLEFLPEIIERAAEWSYALVLTINTSMAKEILPHLGPGKVQYLRLVTSTPDFGKEIPDFMDFVGEALDKGLKCDWLFSIDERPDSEIREVYDTARQIKQMLAGKTGAVNTLFVSETQAGKPIKALEEASEPLIAVSSREIAVYHHIARFIEVPGLVNLTPYFAMPDSNYIIDSSCDVFTIASDQARAKSDNLEKIGRLVDGVVEFDDSSYQPSVTTEPVQRLESCDDCPFALICGVHCGRRTRATDSEPSTCQYAFQQRVESILPLLLFNKIQVG